jgi:hypothetical protein
LRYKHTMNQLREVPIGAEDSLVLKERFNAFTNQLLSAKDLRAAQAVALELRWVYFTINNQLWNGSVWKVWLTQSKAGKNEKAKGPAVTLLENRVDKFTLRPELPQAAPAPASASDAGGVGPCGCRTRRPWRHQSLRLASRSRG